MSPDTLRFLLHSLVDVVCIGAAYVIGRQDGRDRARTEAERPIR